MNKKAIPGLEGLSSEAIEALAEIASELKKQEKENIRLQEREREIKLIWSALDTGSYHNTQRDRVAFLLKNYPSTRDSDMALTLRYWREFQSDLYTDGNIPPALLFKLERLTTISRLRAKIQNEYGLFLGSEEVQQKRRQKELEVKEDMLEDKSPPRIVQVFADETGKNGEYLIVGSVWFLNISRVSSFQAAFSSLTKDRNGKEFHFKECKDSDLNEYKKFVDLAADRLEYVVLKAILTRRKGLSRRNEDAVQRLLYLLLTNGYRDEVAMGRLTTPRSLELIMDQGGFVDQFSRAELQENGSRRICEMIGDGNLISRVSEADSKGSAAIQLADLFAASLNRKFNSEGSERNHKDELADYVLKRLAPEIGELGSDDTCSLLVLK